MAAVVLVRVLIIGLMMLFYGGEAIAQARVSPAPVQQPAVSATFSPVLIELFTAQNCPYCPPADEMLASLSQMPGVIAIACHVDYFAKGDLDLGRPFCRQRQEEYIAAKAASRLYTPMVMINGRYEAIGYKGDKVSAALMKARSDNISSIAINKGEGLMFNFTLPKVETGGAPASLWMMMVDKPHYSQRRGKPIAYVNAAGLYQILGPWDGSAQTKSQPLMIGGIRKGIVIAAQDDASGKILALGRYDF